MKSLFCPLFVVSAALSLASCDKPMPPAAAAPVAAETDSQLAEARDALQRQALEIETKTALMDKQLAEMAQSLKERDNAELRDSLDALKRQNDELRVQADAARQQSNAITQRIVVTPQPNVAPQPMALPDYSLFYDRLAPFGRWFEVNGYGYCWRPTITVASWRPYVDGCWVWSSLGWAWQSNEPFGWATYHYGRWVNLARYGWIWVPGSDWAPAWVAWRQSRDCVGWAPLPPETGVFSGAYRDCDSRYGLGPASYTFINTTQFVSPTYINIYAPVTWQTTIFQNSVNVTQIVPSHSQGHAFVHQGGPPRGQMEQACGRPVPQRQVQTMNADQMPTRQQHHGRRDADTPVAIVELPAVAPGARVRRPEIKEHIQKPVLIGGFAGVPQQEAREIRENIAQEKETAVVQQQPPMRGHLQHAPARRPVEPPTVVNATPAVPSAPPPETVRPARVSEKPGVAPIAVTVETATVQPQPGQGSMPQGSRRHSPDGQPATNPPVQETVRPVVAAEPGAHAAREPRRHGQPGMRAPQAPNVPPESKVVENSAPAAAPSTPSVMPAVVENRAPEPSAASVVPVVEPERTTAPPVVSAPQAVMPQSPADPIVSQKPVAAEKMAAEADRVQNHGGREQAHAAAMEQRRQQEMQERGQAEKRAAEQATANAEAEKIRMQATAAQQEALAAQQQRMAADQAAAQTEKARQQAAATAAQQQEMAAQQQRATAERMASEQAAAAAAAEAERVRQQTEAAAMQQRQQEEATRRAAEEQQMKAQQETERRTQEIAQRQAEEQARRASEEQQMRAQQETERRAQEMAQRQTEETARRQQEAEMQRAQEQARRAAEEQQMRAQQEAERRAQEMAQRQAEEQARRQQEAEMQRAQEQARRAAEEQQMRAQQEAAQRAQEMAQRQAEEQARRAQEMAQRQAEEQARRAQEEAQRAAAEAAQRAAAEAARNQPQPAPGS